MQGIVQSSVDVKAGVMTVPPIAVLQLKEKKRRHSNMTYLS
jgi:hypothetical protein